MSSTSAPRYPSPRPSPFQALAHPSFRRLWFAAWLWMTCMMMELAVASWLVLDLTDSPMEVALVGTFRMLPMFVLGLVAGELADRFPKKRLLVIAQMLNLTGASAMLVLVVTGMVAPWHVYVCTFLIGMAMTTDFPARRGYFAEIFEPSRLTNAITMETAAMMGSFMLGPLMGGLLIAFIGFEGSYSVMVGFFLVSLLLVASVRSSEPIQGRLGTESAVAQVVAGLRNTRRNQTLWSVFVVTAVVNFLGFPFMQMVPVIARDVLGVGSSLYGLLAASIGIGSFGGALVLAALRIQRPGAFFCLGALLLLLSIALFASSEVYLLSLVMLMVAGLGQAGFASMQSAITLQAAPPEMRGRAIGAVLLGIGLHPLGAVVVGTLAEVIGPQLALAILAGFGVVIVGMLRWMYPPLQGWPWSGPAPEDEGVRQVGRATASAPPPAPASQRSAPSPNTTTTTTPVAPSEPATQHRGGGESQ